MTVKKEYRANCQLSTSTLVTLAMFLVMLSLMSSVEGQGTNVPAVPIQVPVLRNTVTFDGRITNNNEWSDATETPLSLQCTTNNCVPLSMEMTVWAKNDGKWIYLLYRVNSATREESGGLISYYWSRGGDSPWEYRDRASIMLDHSYDQWGPPGNLKPDTQVGGQDNVQGKGAYDGTHYWFEFRKELNSGDGRDWNLTVGRTYGVVGVDGLMEVDFWGPVQDYGQAVELSLCPCASVTSVSATTSVFIATSSASVTTSRTTTETTTPPTFITLMPFGTLGWIGLVAAVALVSSVVVLSRRRQAVAKLVPLRQEARAEGTQSNVSEESLPLSKPITSPPSKPSISTGYADLDTTLAGGIPEGYAVVLVSPSYDERDLLLRKIIDSALSSGRPAFYISNDIERTQDLLGRYQRGFYAFSPQADKIASDAANLYKIPGIENLSEANISLALAIKDARAKEQATKMVLIIDVLSDLFLRYKAITTRRWLSDFVGKRKAEGFTTLATLNPLTGTKEDSQTVIDFFDGVIEIFEKELKERSRRFVIVKKMYGKKYSESELMLDKDKLF